MKISEMIIKHAFKYFRNVREDTIVWADTDVDNAELMNSLGYMKLV